MQCLQYAKSKSRIPYKQPWRCNPKLTSAVTASIGLEASKSDVRSVVELWLDMHHKANRIYSSRSRLQNDLLDTARKLYVELHETYGLEYWIPSMMLPPERHFTLKSSWSLSNH